MGKLDNLAFRQREGLLSTLPLALNAVAVWRTLDTSSLARLFPFSPPDLDTRSGTLYGIDLRACAPIVYDPFDGTHLNANTAVLARSGSAARVIRHQAGRAAGPVPGRAGLRHRPRGRVRRHGPRRRWAGPVAGRPWPGHEPLCHRPGRFSEELLQRIGSLRRSDRSDGGGTAFSAERRSSLDHALASYYAEKAGAHRLPGFLFLPRKPRRRGIAHLLRPFATGSLRHLLSDEGDDLLAREALVTVFDLHLLEPELQARRRDGLHRDGVGGSRPGPKAQAAGGGRGLEHHAAPRGRGLHGEHGQGARKHRLGLQFITQDVQDLLSEDSSRTITGHSGRAAVAERRIQAAAPAGRRRRDHVGEAFDLPVELQRWLLSCPRGDGLLLARGNRFPIRIEATPEETEVIEWRPDPGTSHTR